MLVLMMIGINLALLMYTYRTVFKKLTMICVTLQYMYDALPSYSVCSVRIKHCRATNIQTHSLLVKRH
jgi:hypothetical protein